MECIIFYDNNNWETKDKVGKNKEKDENTSSKISAWKNVVSFLQVFGELSVIVVVITFFLNLQRDISDIQKKVEKIDTIYKEIYYNGGIADKLEELEGNIALIKEDVSLIKSDLYVPVINTTDQAMLSTLEGFSIKYKDVDYVAKSLSSEMKIGVDMTGKIRYAKEFLNKTILITYEEENKEIYFLGQYNESYHWEGLCVTNAYYLDGTLYGVCESNFNNGKRLDYKSICLSDTREDRWIFSERVCGKEKNIGINAEYLFEYEEGKKFENETILATDMFGVEELLGIVDYQMMQYYWGNTYNELYNDTTGNAYLVIYNNDGTVNTLCYGNFVNGKFEDNTGSAWDIAYSEKLKCYMYNKGKFRNGRYISNSGKSMVVSVEQIKEIISEYNFDCNLQNWRV